ncbi:MAG: host attachment protein [Gammaproteobacteria bacterium]
MAKIWVMVGDDSGARLFLTNRSAPLQELEDRLNPDTRAGEPPVDPAEHVQHPEDGGRNPVAETARRFVRDVAERLRKGRLAGEYERLFLVAPPTFLGELRRALDEGTRATVVGEVAKNLSAFPPESIRSRLPALL